MPMGDKRLSGIAASDIGKCALGVFKEGEKYIGKTIGICGEQLTIKTDGEKNSARYLTRRWYITKSAPEIYRSFDFPGADDMGNMFQFKRDFEKRVLRIQGQALSRSLNPSLLTFNEWLVQNKDLIPVD